MKKNQSTLHEHALCVKTVAAIQLFHSFYRIDDEDGGYATAHYECQVKRPRP